MRHGTDEWRKFGYSLDSFENALKNLQYHSVFEPVTEPQRPYTVGFFIMRAGASNAVSATGVQAILSEINLGGPHGADLLQPGVLPNFPQLPEAPRRPDGETNHYVDRRHRAVTKARNLREAFLEIERKDHAMLESLSCGYKEGKEKYIGFLAALSLKRHFLSVALQKPSECHYEASTRILLCEIEIPDFAALRITKLRGKSYSDWVEVTAAEKKRLCETLVYALCIRAAYLAAQSDFGNFIDTIAVNALQNWFDPATGAPKAGTIASLQARKEDLLALQPGRFDAKSCFAHLKGISTPSVTHVAPIRPIFVLDKKDHRIVVNRDVDASLTDEENLASIPWEDFEHLVRQLFEWEFGRDGVEVKVTRASRDRGVDAIMFDPDPLRGGKYVLQAKRYTRTVDVAAVRDLYGTVVNEGANRGILVTTSGFGPDSYDFAKDKPLSLVDGPNLVAMLRRHGRNYRINLAEARAIEKP
jgi:restriction system protein